MAAATGDGLDQELAQLIGNLGQLTLIQFAQIGGRCKPVQQWVNLWVHRLYFIAVRVPVLTITANHVVGQPGQDRSVAIQFIQGCQGFIPQLPGTRM